MARIEFFGPIGVGKSTLFDKLLQARGSAPFVLDSPWDARLRLARQLSVSGRSGQAMLHRQMLRVPVHRFQRRAVRFFTRRLRDEVFLTVEEEWRRFLEDMTPILSPAREPWNRIRLESWLLNGVRDAMIFDRYLPERNILIDEGVLKRCVSVLVPRDASKEVPDLVPRLRHLPDSGGFIYVTADRDVVMERNERRVKEWESNTGDARVKFPHKRPRTEAERILFRERQMQASEMVAQFLRESGRTVITIDAGRPLTENVSRILSELGRFR